MKRLSLILLLAGWRLAAPAQTNVPDVLTDIKSDSGTVKMKLDLTIYTGHVRVDHPGMKLTSDWLAANSAHTNNADRRILARTNVVIDLIGDSGKTTNRAAGAPGAKGQATNEVASKMGDPGDNWHVTGEQAVYLYHVEGTVTNESVTISGHAKAVSDKITATGEPLVYDLISKELTGKNYENIINNNAFKPAGTNAAAANTNQVSAPH